MIVSGRTLTKVDKTPCRMRTTGVVELPDKKDLSGKNGPELPDKAALSGKIVEQMKLSGNLKGKEQMTETLTGKLADICVYISQHPHSAKEDIAAFIKRSDETAKKHLQTLVAIGMIAPEGGNKNRTYSIMQ